MEKLEFKPITLQDKDLFDSYFHTYQPPMSEFTFTNLFAWRLCKHYEYAVMDDHLIISFDSRKAFLQPVGKNPAILIEKILAIYPESRFERVEETLAQQLRGKFTIVEEPNNADYVYGTEQLRTLPGNKYAPKRNFIKQCEKCSPSVCILTDDTIKGFMELQQEWCTLRECENDSNLSAENTAVLEALSHFKELKITGICIYVDNKIEGFAIGEALSPTTFVEHFEKGNSNIKGIYQYVLNQFVKNIPLQYTYINREQDLGIEGLRKAKKSYYPVKMITKYILTNKR